MPTNRENYIFIRLISVLLFIVAAVSCSTTALVTAGETCSSLLAPRCEECHYETRVCQKVEKKRGKNSWKRSIKNMVRHGAKINRTEQKQLIECLSQPSSDVLDYCGLNK